MKEWYLMTSNTSPNAIGGFENDAFNDFNEDSFIEALSTNIASTVTLLNCDMSESKNVRCIVQGSTADTQLKSMERSCLFIKGTIKAGMYVQYNHNYWLITGYPDDNGIYEKAVMSLCQHELKWQHPSGRIIKRWANFISASKYDTGREGNKTIILSSNNFTVLLPEDDDSATIDGKRVFIDRDTIKPTKVFEITRSDDVLYLFGEYHGGVLSFIADKSEFDSNKDNQKLGICDYYKTPTSTVEQKVFDNGITTTIVGNPEIRTGYSRIYSATFIDNKTSDEINDIYYTWKVVSDVPLQYEVYENKIAFNINDEDMIGHNFALQVVDFEENILAEKAIFIRESF